VEDAAAGEVLRFGEVEGERAVLVEAEAFDLGFGVGHERWGGRVGVEAADAFAGEGGGHLDDDGVRSGREGAAAGPRQGLFEVVADEGAGEAVEEVGAAGPGVAAQAGEAVGEAARPDEVRCGDVESLAAQARGDAFDEGSGRGVGSFLPEPLVVLGGGHAGLVAGEGVEAPERVGHEEAAGVGAFGGEGQFGALGGPVGGEAAQGGGVEAAAHD
jgi:hypothetical protein